MKSVEDFLLNVIGDDVLNSFSGDRLERALGHRVKLAIREARNAALEEAAQAVFDMKDRYPPEVEPKTWAALFAAWQAIRELKDD